MTAIPSSKLVTIFGGSGFLGRYLVKRLATTGRPIRIATRDPEAGLFLKPMGAVGQIDLVLANVVLLWLNAWLLFVAFLSIAFAASVSFDRMPPALGVPLAIVLVFYVADALGSIERLARDATMRRS